MKGMINKSMQNWAGNLQFTPADIAYPSRSEEIRKRVLDAISANQKIRVVGSGHSWTDLIATDGLLISLDQYEGIIKNEKDEFIIRAGTKIKKLGELLFNEGLGLENLGDIDVQSIAGAISTGTHGTGICFGSIATQIEEIKFINGRGEEITCSDKENNSLFKCAQVSLGALGIITEMKCRCMPAYKLVFEAKKEKFSDVIAQLDKLIAQNRNFEFYWFPYSEVVQTRYSNITQDDVEKPGIGSFINDILLENGALKVVSELARIFPFFAPSASKLAASLVSGTKKKNWSHKVYATARLVRFNEMEYNIPIPRFKELVREVADVVAKNRFKINFPTENRFVKADDIYLSPAYNRDSAYIAAHVYKGMDYKPYFETLESIFINNGGRPHWGKMHTQKADYLCTVYPRWNDFLKWRQEMDPKGIFLNNHLHEILGC